MIDKLKGILGVKYVDHVAPADDYLVIYTRTDYSISFQEMKELAFCCGSEKLSVSSSFNETTIVVNNLTFAQSRYNKERTI